MVLHCNDARLSRNPQLVIICDRLRTQSALDYRFGMTLHGSLDGLPLQLPRIRLRRSSRRINCNLFHSSSNKDVFCSELRSQEFSPRRKLIKKRFEGVFDVLWRTFVHFSPFKWLTQTRDGLLQLFRCLRKLFSLNWRQLMFCQIAKLHEKVFQPTRPTKPTLQLRTNQNNLAWSCDWFSHESRRSKKIFRFASPQWRPVMGSRSSRRCVCLFVGIRRR